MYNKKLQDGANMFCSDKSKKTTLNNGYFGSQIDLHQQAGLKRTSTLSSQLCSYTYTGLFETRSSSKGSSHHISIPTTTSTAITTTHYIHELTPDTTWQSAKDLPLAPTCFLLLSMCKITFVVKHLTTLGYNNIASYHTSLLSAPCLNTKSYIRLHSFGHPCPSPPLSLALYTSRKENQES